jgi:outer membrane receptor for monomeric catechols
VAQHDHYHVNRYDEQVPATTINDLEGNGWNAGTVYEPVKDLSVYAQYAVASDPVNSLSSIAANQQGFHLSPGRQVEGGLKQRLFKGRAEWTLAMYNLTKKGLLTPAVNNPTLTDQVGAQSSHGVEGSISSTLRLSHSGQVICSSMSKDSWEEEYGLCQPAENPLGASLDCQPVVRLRGRLWVCARGAS